MALRGQGSEGVTRLVPRHQNKIGEHPGIHNTKGIRKTKQQGSRAGRAAGAGRNTDTGTTQHRGQEEEKPGGSGRQEEKGTPEPFFLLQRLDSSR